MAQPIYPRNDSDPTSQGRRVAGAMRAFSKRLKLVQREYLKLINGLPYRTIQLNFSGRKLQFNATVYKYELSAGILDNLLADIGAIIDRIILEGGEQRLWFGTQYVIPAYQQGSAMAQANLAAQSITYASAVPDVESILFSPEYQRRIGYVRAREFELMKGFTGDMKKELALILTDGVALGVGPREMSKSIRERVGVNESRANRIARTEPLVALRRARMDEAEKAQIDLGIETKLMHVSALSKTTRPTHAARHGNLYTIQEQREWWQQGANSINCFVPDTMVSGRFHAGSKAKYRGPIVNIVTASGRNLTVTPNHPVMGSGGLVAAAEVNKGDNLLAYGVKNKNSVGVFALDSELGHARIQDVFSSLSDIGHSSFTGVSAVDFHGDGRLMDEDVNVVLSNRLLTGACDTHVGETLDYIKLKHSDSVSSYSGSLGNPLETLLNTTDCIVSGRGICKPFLCGHIGMSNYCCVGHTPPTETDIPKQSVYGDPGYASPLADGLNCFTTNVGGVEGGDVNFIPQLGNILRGLEPSIKEPDVNRPTGNANIFGDLLDANSVFAFLDEVVDINISFFDGHVYDLQEKSGLMIANGLIISNCKCSTIEVILENGEVLYPSVIEKAKKQEALFAATAK